VADDFQLFKSSLLTPTPFQNKKIFGVFFLIGNMRLVHAGFFKIKKKNNDRRN